MIVVGRVLDTDYELSKLYDSSFTTMFRQGTDKK
jgi:precorrin-4/cobalt-precorrin-4 C11-methyltransferase